MSRRNENGVFVAGPQTERSIEEVSELVLSFLKEGPHTTSALLRRLQQRAKADRLKTVLESLEIGGFVLKSTPGISGPGRPTTIYSLT